MRSDDDLLLSQLKKGDKEAFDKLFYRYAGKIFNFAKSFCNDDADAEEVVQETFLRIWLKRDTITNFKSFDAYIFTISKNFVFNNLRKSFHRKKYQQHLGKSSLPGENTTLNDFHFEETNLAITAIIDQFPPKRREVFLLSRKQGLTNKEIAEKPEISTKAVEYHISHSLGYLKQSLGQHPGNTLILLLIGFAILS